MNIKTINNYIEPHPIYFSYYDHCPYCNHDRYYIIRKTNYRCNKCRREWSFRKGTILENSTLSVEKYNQIIALVKQGYSVSQIANKINCYYYAVYKIVYKYNKEKCKPKSSILRILKNRLHETNFSIAQSTGLAPSIVAKAMASTTKYHINPEHYKKIYNYLTEQSRKSKTKLVKVLSLPDISKLPQLYELRLNQKQTKYAQDILFLASCIGKKHINNIPDKFFYDYLYRAQVKEYSMRMTLNILKRNDYIYLVNGKIAKATNYHTYHSEKKQIYLLSSLASYLFKHGDFVQAFGFALLQNNKKQIDECFVKALIQYENLSDSNKRLELISSYEDKYIRTSPYVYANILYHKIMMAEISLGNMTKQLHDIKKYFSVVGVLKEKSSEDFLQKLGYETHMIFFALYKNFQFLNCIYFTLRTKQYYREKIDSTANNYLLYHLLELNYHLIEKNELKVLDQQIQDLKNIRNIELTPIYFQNALYFFYLFYAIVRKNNPMIKQYYDLLLDKNGDKYIIANDLLNRYESLALLYANRKKYTCIHLFFYSNGLGKSAKTGIENSSF